MSTELDVAALQAKRRAAGTQQSVAESTGARLAAAAANAARIESGTVLAQPSAETLASGATSGATADAPNGGTVDPPIPAGSGAALGAPAVPPNGASADAQNGASLMKSAPSDPEAVPKPPAVARIAPETLRQGMTFLAEDFGKLQDIVHALGRSHRVRNPLNAKLGPSHVAGAMIHSMLPLWDEDPQKIVAMVETFLQQWVG